MAVFGISNINYVIAGNTTDIVNVELYRLDNDGSIDKEAPLSSNVSFFTDRGGPMVVDENPYTLSLETRVHRIRKTNTDVGKDDYVLSGNLIYDLFDARDVIYGTDVYTHNPDGISNIIDSRLMMDIYSPKIEQNFLDFVPLGGFSFFGMTAPMEKCPNFVVTTQRDDRLHRLSNDSGKMIWNYKLSSGFADTFSYTPLSDLRVNVLNYGQDDYDPYDEKHRPSPELGYYGWALTYGELSTARLTSLFDNKFNMVNISVNYMFEGNIVTEDGKQGQGMPDFRRGIIGTTMYTGKNQYDSTYAMRMPNQTSLVSARQYIGAGAVGGEKPFLKYFDSVDYRKRDQRPEEPKNFPLPALSSDATQTMEMVEIPRKDDNERILLPYQSVEIFDSNNRGINSAKHKSNLYSVSLNGVGIDASCLKAGKDLTRIETDIKNTIRKIAESLEPAHTQLFNVYFKPGAGETDALKTENNKSLIRLEISRNARNSVEKEKANKDDKEEEKQQ